MWQKGAAWPTASAVTGSAKTTIGNHSGVTGCSIEKMNRWAVDRGLTSRRYAHFRGGPLLSSIFLGYLIGLFAGCLQVIDMKGLFGVVQKQPNQPGGDGNRACADFAGACPQSYPQKMWISRQALEAQELSRFRREFTSSLCAKLPAVSAREGPGPDATIPAMRGSSVRFARWPAP